MADKLLKTHVFCFNPYDNSGEGLFLTTQFFANGDPITDTEGIYLNQELRLQSYCNSASFNLYGAYITPELLRKLADQLEQARNKIYKRKSRNTNITE